MSEIATLHEPFERFLRERKIPYIRARSDQKSTIALGHPDFSILMRNSCLLIEFKTKEGALSKAQKERIAELEAAGNKVHIIRDLNAAIELVQAWLSTLKGVELVRHGQAALVWNPKRLHRIGTALYEERDGQLHKIEQPGCRVVIGRAG